MRETALLMLSAGTPRLYKALLALNDTGRNRRILADHFSHLFKGSASERPTTLHPHRRFRQRR